MSLPSRRVGRGWWEKTPAWDGGRVDGVLVNPIRALRRSDRRLEGALLRRQRRDDEANCVKTGGCLAGSASGQITVGGRE